MKRSIFRILQLCLLFACASHAAAQTEPVAPQVSILTCSPGDKVYSLYGHTAIRCRDEAHDLDVVFNYGCFSFEQPHFLWRFVLGQCDYMVLPIPWEYFVVDYEKRGSRITEQTLNLTADEALGVFAYLDRNCQPENRQYRYNYLYNNCTTKVRDVYETVIRGRVEYPEQENALSFRQYIHRYTKSHPWAQEGNDALLGADVDQPIATREAMFLPENLMQFAAEAVSVDSVGVSRPLVNTTEIILQEDPSKAATAKSVLPSPRVVGWSLFVLAVGLVVWELRRRTWLWCWDVLLLVLRGVAGLLLCFMFFFSEHPAVGSNWLILLLNPLAFVGLVLVIRARRNGQTTRWFAFDLAILTLFLAFSALGLQEFGKIIVPLTFVLMTRPIRYYLAQRKK